MTDYMQTLMEPVLGGTIIEVGMSKDTEFGWVPTLTVKCKDGQTRKVWFMGDEEGNGSGFPHIS